MYICISNAFLIPTNNRYFRLSRITWALKAKYNFHDFYWNDKFHSAKYKMLTQCTNQLETDQSSPNNSWKSLYFTSVNVNM